MISPASISRAIRCTVRAVAASPASMAAVSGDGPRCKGRADGCRLIPPSGKRGSSPGETRSIAELASGAW